MAFDPAPVYQALLQAHELLRKARLCALGAALPMLEAAQPPDSELWRGLWQEGRPEWQALLGEVQALAVLYLGSSGVPIYVQHAVGAAATCRALGDGLLASDDAIEDFSVIDSWQSYTKHKTIPTIAKALGLLEQRFAAEMLRPDGSEAGTPPAASSDAGHASSDMGETRSVDGLADNGMFIHDGKAYPFLAGQVFADFKELWERRHHRAEERNLSATRSQLRRMAAEARRWFREHSIPWTINRRGGFIEIVNEPPTGLPARKKRRRPRGKKM